MKTKKTQSDRVPASVNKTDTGRLDIPSDIRISVKNKVLTISSTTSTTPLLVAETTSPKDAAKKSTKFLTGYIYWRETNCPTAEDRERVAKRRELLSIRAKLYAQDSDDIL